MLSIEGDKDFDLLYIYLWDRPLKETAAQTKEVSPGVIFDFDAEGKLMGIEILNTKEVLGIPVERLL